MQPCAELCEKTFANAGGKVTGSVFVGGFPKEQASFSRVMGYCQQEDIHVPYVSPATNLTPDLQTKALDVLINFAVLAAPFACFKQALSSAVASHCGAPYVPGAHHHHGMMNTEQDVLSADEHILC